MYHKTLIFYILSSDLLLFPTYDTGHPLATSIFCILYSGFCILNHVSKIKVTGPSLAISTSILAWNRPSAVTTPQALSAAINRR